jgi:hypothetical protein
MMIAASDLLSVYQLLFNKENEYSFQVARVKDLNIPPQFKDLILYLRTARTSSTGELATGSSPLPVPVIHYVQGFVC